MDRRYALNSVRLQTAVLAISVKTLFNNWTKHWTKPLLIIYTSTASLRRGRLTAAMEVSARLQNCHAIEYAPAQTLPSQPTRDNKRHFIQCLKANWEKGGPRIRIEKKKFVWMMMRMCPTAPSLEATPFSGPTLVLPCVIKSAFAASHRQADAERRQRPQTAHSSWNVHGCKGDHLISQSLPKTKRGSPVTTYTKLI